MHAIGGQLGITYVPWPVLANVEYLTELSAHDRFQGDVLMLTLAVRFFEAQLPVALRPHGFLTSSRASIRSFCVSATSL